MKASMFKYVSLIQIILVILKAFNVISCSWWCVFIPLMIYFGVIILVLIICGIILIANLITPINKNKNKES